MRLAFAAVAGCLLAAAGPASAQYTFKPIDTDKYLVQPTDQATGFLAGATQALSRAAASAIDTSGYTRTINAIFGTKAKPAPTQPGFSPLPSPGMYPSTRYTSPIHPTLPTTSTYHP